MSTGRGESGTAAGVERAGASGPPEVNAVTWHDVECASYAVDLELWRSLVAEHGDPVLDVGCGTGRVALDLALRGHDLTCLDSDPELVRTLAARARERGVRVRTAVGDARSVVVPGTPFRLAIAAMQVFQLLGGPVGRAQALASIRSHLRGGAVLAIALADPLEGFSAADALPPLPDVREESGWVLSSQPVALRPGPEAIEIDRLRQAVTPRGELTEQLVTICLDRVEAAGLEAQAEAAGYRSLDRRRVEQTRDHVGSTVVVLEAV